MSFRKRNVALSTGPRSGESPASPSSPKTQLPGVRPSSLDGRLVTSTGTAHLDGLLGGHGGLALGCSLLIEENGTTDYAGALLKFYASEGLLQGQHVHVVGLSEQWGRELPGAVGDSEKREKPGDTGSKMKIAWRYESLGQFGASTTSREHQRIQQTPSPTEIDSTDRPKPFNHTFDLTKRLIHPTSSQISFYQLNTHPNLSPFTQALEKLTLSLVTQSSALHRLILPSLLSPALYSPHASHPTHLLSFLHTLRSLLSSSRLTILTSLPLSLHPRSSGLTRFIEILHDGVLELSPFPHSSIPLIAASPSSTTAHDDLEAPQGLLRIHKLPILHERGSGTAGYEEDWTFSLSRRKLNIKPFTLPPLEGDREAQEVAVGGGGSGGENKGKHGMEF